MSESTVQCLCNHCSGEIILAVSHAGESATCPHCGLETILYVPHAPRGEVPPAPPPQPAAPPADPPLGSPQPHTPGSNRDLRGLGSWMLFLGMVVLVGGWLVTIIDPVLGIGIIIGIAAVMISGSVLILAGEVRAKSRVFQRRKRDDPSGH